MMNLIGKIIYLITISLFVIAASCRKIEVTPDNNMQEVVFTTDIVSGGLKNGTEINDGNGVDYALIKIDTMVFKPQVFVLDGSVYTQAIKLTPGLYNISSFLLMNDNNTVNDFSDDFIMLAAPVQGSDYASFVNRPAGIDFTVDNFKKAEIEMEVLYFNSSDYDKFGFDFDVLPNTTIRTQYFKGIINTCHTDEYYGSLYESQTGGVNSQMNAIFRIDVYRNGRFVKSYDNFNSFGDSIVTVKYPDDDNIKDVFDFQLFIYAKSGNGFDYNPLHIWHFEDTDLLVSNGDGVVDFSIGSSPSFSFDYVFGNYIDLPKTTSLTINSQWAPGNLNTYFDAELTNVDAAHQLGNGSYPAWCGTDSVNININHPYEMDVYSSLFYGLLPEYIKYPDKWNKINWLFNNLSQYNGYSWRDIQGAVWIILNNWDGTGHDNIPDITPMMINISEDANNHPDFIPVCGQKAAVIFVPHRTKPDANYPVVQVVFTLINI
jgi:hypothetical protein